jgi:TPR repeat protein
MFQKIIVGLLLSLISFSALDANELKDACQVDNNATACYYFGLPLITGENAKVQDIKEEGLSYMRRACMEGETRGCDAMGENYYNNKNYKIAMTYLEESCSRDVKFSCEAMGTIYRDGHDIRADFVKSREYYEKACELKSGDACFNVAIMYRGGFGVEKNRAKEKEYYKKGCDEGRKTACERFTDLDNEDKGIETGIWATIKSWFK